MKDLLIDGYSLRQRDKGFFLDSHTTLPAVARRNVSLVTAPGLHGAVPVPGGYGPGRVALSLVVRGGDEAELASRVSELQARLTNAQTVARVDGEDTREASVYEVVVAAPAWSAGFSSVAVSAVLTVAPFWQENPVTALSQVHTVWEKPEPFSAWDGCTGRLADAVVRLKGPQGPVVVSDGRGGTWKARPTGEDRYRFLDTARWVEWESPNRDAWDAPAGTVFPEYASRERLALVPVADPSQAGLGQKFWLSTDSPQGVEVAVRASRWWL